MQKTVNNIYIYIERERERERERENNHIFLGEDVREIANLYKRKWVKEYSKENV